MGRVKNLIKVLLTKALAKKIIAIVLLISAIYFFRDFAFIFFITFVLAFIFLAI
jgi:predicted PurR-regulated permease PerM